MSKKFSKEQLVEELRLLQNNKDSESAHAQADGLLLKYINSEEVAKAFSKIEKWYA